MSVTRIHNAAQMLQNSKLKYPKKHFIILNIEHQIKKINIFFLISGLFIISYGARLFAIPIVYDVYMYYCLQSRPIYPKVVC